MEQLIRGVEPDGVKFDIRLTNIKFLHAHWIIPSLSSKNITFGGFKKGHITQPVKEVHSFIKRYENPFEEIVVSLWLIITLMTNMINMTFTPDGRGVLHLLDIILRDIMFILCY